MYIKSRLQDDDIDFDREKEDVAGLQFARMTRMIDRRVISSYTCASTFRLDCPWGNV